MSLLTQLLEEEEEEEEIIYGGGGGGHMPYIPSGNKAVLELSFPYYSHCEKMSLWETVVAMGICRVGYCLLRKWRVGNCRGGRLSFEKLLGGILSSGKQSCWKLSSGKLSLEKCCIGNCRVGKLSCGKLSWIRFNVTTSGSSKP